MFLPNSRSITATSVSHYRGFTAVPFPVQVSFVATLRACHVTAYHSTRRSHLHTTPLTMPRRMQRGSCRSSRHYT